MSEELDLAQINFGRRLKTARRMIGFSRQDMANELVVPAAEYSHLEDGGLSPDLETLEVIAKVTGKSLHWMITGREYTTAESEAA